MPRQDLMGVPAHRGPGAPAQGHTSGGFLPYVPMSSCETTSTNRTAPAFSGAPARYLANALGDFYITHSSVSLAYFPVEDSRLQPEGLDAVRAVRSAPPPQRGPAPAGNGRNGSAMAWRIARDLGLRFARLVGRAASHRTRRTPILILAEVAFAAFSVVSAAAFVHSGEFWAWPPAVVRAALLLAALQILFSALSGAFDVRWRYVGLRDALVVARSGLLSSAVGLGVVQLAGDRETALRFVASAGAVYLLTALGARLLVRWLHEWAQRAAVGSATDARRAIIVGAGGAGSSIVKTLLASPRHLTEPVAVVDDDRNKHGILLHGVPIVGGVDDLAEMVREYRAEEIIIAIPSATREQIGQVVDACLATKVPFLIAPDPEDPFGNGVGHGGLRVVQPGDLLGRLPVSLNVTQMRAELGGARIVVTGGAGSIGSELARQLARLQPAALYLIDRNENDLHFLRGELDSRHPDVPHYEIIRDIRNQQRMTRILKEIRPTHVFHAAAFKHVPLMEAHPVAAVENNVLGTWVLLEASAEAGVGKFVFISTDKAVEPSSVMGATKRLAEMLVSEYTLTGSMQGVIVRFGNVLGSNGSVVPLFQRQIAEGGPVTVTSREATRYFMTTVEAVQLVLQATALEETTGKISILDMGTPVRIVDLAERLIALSGFRPGVDIEIVETGLRPGEKLHEQLWWESEHAQASSHPMISLADATQLPGGAIRQIPRIKELVDAEDSESLRAFLERTTGLKPLERPAAALPAAPSRPRPAPERVEVPRTVATP